MEDKKQDDEKDKKVPKIRFKGFTGEWEQKRIGEIAEKTYGGGTPKTNVPEYWNGEIPWIQSSNLSEHNLFDVDIQKHITNIGLQESATQLVSENSIAVVSHVGVGKLAFMPIKYTTSQDFISLSKLNTDPVFTCYSLYKKIQNDLHLVQGSTIKGITKDDLLNKVIMIPETLEQKKIGEFFYNLDNLITLQQRKSDELKEVKKYMLQKMFPKNGETKPEIRFAGFTDDWKQHKLGEVTIPIKLKAKDNDYPVYSVTNQQGFIPQAEQFTDREVASKNKANYSVVSKNQFAYNPSRINVGSIAYLKSDIKVIISPLYVVFECTDRLDKDFLNCFISTDSFKNQRETNTEGSVRDSLSYDGFSEISICLPSIQEQISIGKFFDSLDNLITLHQNKCDELKELKKYMLQNMFPRM